MTNTADNNIESNQIGPILNLIEQDARNSPSLESLRTIEKNIWKWYSEMFPEPNQMNLELEDIKRSWQRTVFEQNHAAFLLEQQGFVESAVANVRCAMEHAIHACYIDQDVNARDQIAKAASKHLKGIRESIEGINNRELSDNSVSVLSTLLDGLLDNDENTEGHVNSLKEECERIENGGSSIYFCYRLLSGLMHPGLFSASMQFFQVHASTDSIDLFTPHSQFILRFGIGACSWAGWSIDASRGVANFDDEFGKIARGLDFEPLHFVSAQNLR